MYEEKWCSRVADQIAENLNSDSVRFDEDVLLNSGGQIRYVEIYKNDGEERLIDLSATYRNAKYLPPEVAAQLVADQILSEEPEPLMDTESYDLVKGHLNYFLISEVLNGDYLCDKVYTVENGLAVVAALFVIGDKGVNFMPVRKGMLRKWGVSSETVMNDARENSATQTPAVMGQLDETPLPVLAAAGVGPTSQLHIVTTNARTFGASAILQPHVLEDVYDILGSDYYVMPYASDFVFVIPDVGQDPIPLYYELSRNNLSLPREKILSTFIYRYDYENGLELVKTEGMLRAIVTDMIDDCLSAHQAYIRRKLLVEDAMSCFGKRYVPSPYDDTFTDMEDGDTDVDRMAEAYLKDLKDLK